MRSCLYALLALILLTASTGKNEFSIKGSSKDFADGNKVYLFYFDSNDEPVFIDSTVCKNNSFAFSGVADTAKSVTVAVVDATKHEDGISIDLILEPGKISIGEFDAEKSHIHVATGTPLNDVLDRFSHEVGAYVENPDSLFPFIASYIKGNIDNPVGGYLFDRYHFSMPWDMKLELINSMSEGQRVSYAAISEETLMRIEQEKERAAKARGLFPGPIFMLGHGIRAWSLSVGLPKGVRPKATAACTKGWSTAMRLLFRRKLRAFTSLFTAPQIASYNSRFEYISLLRTSTVKVHSAGTTLCCVPAFTMVTDIFTGPNNSLSRSQRCVRNHCMSSIA